MRDASNSCILRVVLCACFMTLPALLFAQNEPIKYIGPGSCAATSCHGSVKPIAGSRILQNEYSTWIIQDKHSRAYQALTGDVGERMARILKLGAKNKFVDHEMIAAGHPDLYFELNSFSAVMPRHWKSPRESEPGKPAEDAAWVGMREWSAGQAVQLRAAMERLTWRAKNERFDKKDVWPEYSELSCF